MGTRIYGIGSTQDVDHAGERVILKGLNTDRLSFLRDEHGDDTFSTKVGLIDYHKKIFSEQECENEKQLRCWKFAGGPFLYAEGELADDQDHPDAIATAAWARFTQRPNSPVTLGFSVDGGILERQDANGTPTEDKETGKTLSQALCSSLAITLKPCNPKCRLFLENDLAKSVTSAPVPKDYKERLAKSQATSSVFETKEFQQIRTLVKIDSLKKSMEELTKGITSIRCKQCGVPARFFKSQPPHRCQNSQCNHPHTMMDLWKSINKPT